MLPLAANTGAVELVLQDGARGRGAYHSSRLGTLPLGRGWGVS